MKIFTCEQIREIDRYTIENEPVKSSELMERAAGKLYEWIVSRYGKGRRFLVFAGPGNNGGDGLALARFLADSGHRTEVHYLRFTNKESDDWKVNRQRLERIKTCRFFTIAAPAHFPMTLSDDIIIDAIFGSGLSRAPEGLAASVIKSINDSGCEVISVDIPSGMSGENIADDKPELVVKASHTLTFQFPKLSFMFRESWRYTGDWHILPIGLHPEAIARTNSPYTFVQEADVFPLIRQRGKFDHKGTFGHGLLVAGSAGKTGAAILSAKGALRSGIGLLTCHIPPACRIPLLSNLPEAMVETDKHDEIITGLESTDRYHAIGVGPGIGIESETSEMFKKLLRSFRGPMIIDADALNIISSSGELKKHLHPGIILTPHPGEFERLAGIKASGYDQLMLQVSLSREWKCIIVLKGACTSISLPDGRVFFNSTGNPGMATAGSGDVLTGIILSLLAQGYESSNAAIAGVFIHGLAGDIASETTGEEALIASDIINNIGAAFRRLKEN